MGDRVTSNIFVADKPVTHDSVDQFHQLDGFHLFQIQEGMTAAQALAQLRTSANGANVDEAILKGKDGKYYLLCDRTLPAAIVDGAKVRVLDVEGAVVGVNRADSAKRNKQYNFVAQDLAGFGAGVVGIVGGAFVGSGMTWFTGPGAILGSLGGMALGLYGGEKLGREVVSNTDAVDRRNPVDMSRIYPLQNVGIAGALKKP